MSRCPYLDYESHNLVFSYNDKFICKLSGKEMDTDDPKVKHTCKADYGDEYEKCSVYKDRR